VNFQEFQKQVEENLEAPYQLEVLYRQQPEWFAQIIKELAPHHQTLLIQAWEARLSYVPPSQTQGAKPVTGRKGPHRLPYMVAGSVVWLFWRFLIEFSQIPIGWIFAVLCVWVGLVFGWAMENFSFSSKKLRILGLLSLGVLLFHAVFYGYSNNPSVVNSQIHQSAWMWLLVAWFASDFSWNNKTQFLDFMRLSFETLVWFAIFNFFGAILIVLSFALLSMVQLDVFVFYVNNVIPLGLSLSLFLGLSFARDYAHWQLSKIVARLFTPLALLTLIIYLFIHLTASHSLVQDREALLTYSVIVAAALALIFLGLAHEGGNGLGLWFNLLLTLASILTGLVVVVQFGLRLITLGVTPNRLVGFGNNLVMVIHLSFIALALIPNLRGAASYNQVSTTVVRFLPVYLVWLSAVVFLMPLVWGWW